MDEILKKKDGFSGQKAIVIPRQILNNKCAKNKIINNLYITDIGYYPKARYHYRERTNGADQHIMIYCHEGSGMIFFRDKEYHLDAGDYCFIPMKTPHSYHADDNNPWTIYWVHFKGVSADNIVAEQNGKSQLKGFIKNSGKCIELFNEIYEHLELGYASDTLIYANMCFWNFMGSLICNEASGSLDKLSSRNITELAIDFLKRNTHKALSLAEIAGTVNLSQSHFSFLFKKKTGFSPIEYFNHLKVQKACQYLHFTNLRIKEISLELGITDQYYFSRLFTNVMGISPNEYRMKRMH